MISCFSTALIGVFRSLLISDLLGTGESNVSIVLLNSVLHRSSSLSDVHLAAFTGNPVNSLAGSALLFGFA